MSLKSLAIALAFGILLSAPVLAQPGPGPVPPATAFNIGTNVKTLSLPNYGAVCDAAAKSGGSTTASSTAFSGAFLSSNIGQTYAIQIPGAGAGGAALATTITPTSSSAGTLGTAAAGSASSATQGAYFAAVNIAGDGTDSYAPGDTVTLASGTSATPTVLTVNNSQLIGGTYTGGTMSGYAIGDKLFLTAVGGAQLGQPSLIVTGVSAGAVTAAQLVDGGNFTGNATSFTQASNSATAGTGFTVTVPRFGVSYLPGAVSVTTPGLYTSVPANMVAQASSSGSGTGATFFIAWHTDGDYYYGTDNTSAIASAITAAEATPGVGVSLPNAACGVASTITVNSSFVGFFGLAPPQRFTNAVPQYTAGLMWLGGTGGTTLQFASVTGGSTTSIAGSIVQGVSFLENGVGGIGVQLLSDNNVRLIDNYFQDPTIAGIDVNVVSGSLLTEADSQQIAISGTVGNITNGAGALIRLEATSPANASYVYIDNTEANYKNGEIFSFQSADHVFARGLQAYRQPGGIGIGIELSCLGTGLNFATEDSVFDEMTPAAGGMVIRGTETCPVGAPRNAAPHYDVGNQSPQIQLGVGATLEYSPGTMSGNPTLSEGQVYFNSPSTSQNTTTQNTSGTNSSGSYSLVMAVVTNLVKGDVSQGNTGIADGTIITAINTLTLTLSAPLTATITTGTAEKFFAPAVMRPQDGGGLVIDGTMRIVKNNGVWFPPNSLAGAAPPAASEVEYVYAVHQMANVIGAANSDGTRNLVRLTLNTTAGFQTGDAIWCGGIAGTTEADTPAQNIAIGNLVDGTHIDLQGVTFVNAYQGGGTCEWFGLLFNVNGHASLPTNIETEATAPSLALVGMVQIFSSAGKAAFDVNANATTSANIASWFNRKPISCTVGAATVSSSATATTTTYAELNTLYRCNFFVWDDAVNGGGVASNNNQWIIVSDASNGTIVDQCAVAIGFNGITAEATDQVTPSDSTVEQPLTIAGYKLGLSEGSNYGTILGKTITGGTCTYDHSHTTISIQSLQ